MFEKNVKIMVTKSLKEKVLMSIENVKDDHVLQHVLDLIELENDHEAIFEFNEQQLEAIEKAKEEVLEGKTISNEAANKEIDEWLSK